MWPPPPIPPSLPPPSPPRRLSWKLGPDCRPGVVAHPPVSNGEQDQRTYPRDHRTPPNAWPIAGGGSGRERLEPPPGLEPEPLGRDRHHGLTRAFAAASAS